MASRGKERQTRKMDCVMTTSTQAHTRSNRSTYTRTPKWPPSRTLSFKDRTWGKKTRKRNGHQVAELSHSQLLDHQTSISGLSQRHVSSQAQLSAAVRLYTCAHTHTLARGESVVLMRGSIPYKHRFLKHGSLQTRFPCKHGFRQENTLLGQSAEGGE